MSKQQALALLNERAGYVRYGRDERTAQVDAELARLGFRADDNGQLAAVEPAKAAPPRKERAVVNPAPERTGKD